MDQQFAQQAANPSDTDASGAAAGAGAVKNRPRYLLTFFLLFLTWILFSGRFDAFHLTCGALSCALTSYLSAGMLFRSRPGFRVTSTPFKFIFSYLPWLLYQILLANIHVAYLSLSPRMMELIDPQFIKFESSLKTNMGLVTLANSITLTPGTITVSVTKDGYFRVHAIDLASAQGFPGEMEKRVADVFESHDG